MGRGNGGKIGLLRFAATALLLGCGCCLSVAQDLPSSNPDAMSVPVYVQDLELSALGPNGPERANPQGAGASARTPQFRSQSANTLPQSPVIFLDSDVPAVRARKLIEFFSQTLVQTLQKSGYAAKSAQGSRPDDGVMLRGIIAEVDPMNRVRKAILGSGSTNPRFSLYVASFNLARPDQALYQIAPVQDDDPRFGPVIALNNYIPMMKYELAKDPTEDDIRKICGDIAVNLGKLLKANPDAFRH
ncbi:MAG: DUF4410 domain-containing protein [Candidatus Acidiferrum sp.]